MLRPTLIVLSLLLAMPAIANSDAEQRLRTDWPWLARFQEDNQRLVANKAQVDIVFMGDSITQGWPDKQPDFFAPTGRVNRGISGQTTPQMLLRFRQDVIDLKPRAVHIMAGTNDIAGNTGPMTPAQTQANIMSMVELAQAHGIKVILASIPPAAAFPWRKEVAPAERIQAMNQWLRAYATQVGAVYADYTSVLDDGKGGMKQGFADDGVHPTADGYAAMFPVTEAAIKQALER